MRSIASIVCLMMIWLFATPLSSQHRQIIQAEYFWNIDPGAGNGNALQAIDSNFDQALEGVFENPTNLPAPGLHLLGIRVMAANGSWSPVFSSVVEVVGTVNTTPVFNLTAAECFWGNDPGPGFGTPLLAFNGNFDEALESVVGSMVTPSAGFQRFSIRIKDATNSWGPVFSTVVEVTNAITTSSTTIKVQAAELFWNTDPGQGNGIPLLALNGNFDEALETAIASNNVPTTIGKHLLYIRIRDQQNWGPAFSAVVEVLPTTPTNNIRSIKVAAAEYFFDNDPGQGNATPMLAFDGNFNSALEKIMGGTIPRPVTAGYHTLYMRVQDGANNWGNAFGVVVNIDTTIGFTTQIIGTTILCPSALTGVAYSAPAIFGNTYNWSITGGSIVAGAGTRNITVNWNPTGTHQLQLVECTANGAFCDSTTITVTIKPNPATAITQTICQGQSYLGYTTTGTYRDTFVAANGCDSIRTLMLTVNPIVRTTVNNTICNGQQYHGYSAAGTYVDTLRAVTGCDSIRTLVLTIQQSFNTTISRTVCFGSSYLGYNNTGTYSDTFVHPSGCDSVRILFLTVLPQIADTVITTICQGDSYLGYSSSGSYVDTFSAFNGCDSIRTLFLTVRPQASTTITTTVCFGGIFAGYNTTGTYRDTFSAANGCDSIRTINLTVRPRIATIINQSICPGQSFLGRSVTGTFIDTFTTASGCDSLRILNLTVKLVPQTTINQTVCYGASYLGYSQSGTYIDTFAATNGCDSIRILNLIIEQKITYIRTVTACEGDVVDGYTLSGTYIDTLRAANGCDSIRKLNLTVIPQQVTLNKVRICPGDSILLGNTWYHTWGTFRDTTVNANGCNDITITVLEINTPPAMPVIVANGSVLSVQGNYVTYTWYKDGQIIAGKTTSQLNVDEAGSYVVKVTDENTCKAVSEPYEMVLETSVTDLATDWQLKCYPNPTTGIVHLAIEGAVEAQVSLFNSMGQLLYQLPLAGQQTILLDLAPYPNGIYYLKTETGKQIKTTKVLKLE